MGGGGGGGAQALASNAISNAFACYYCVCFSSNVLMKKQNGRASNNDVVHNY